MEMNNQKAKKVVERKDVPEETQKVDTIPQKGRRHALEMAIVRYRRTLADEAAGLRFGDLQPLVMGLERLAGTDLAMVMVALGVIQRKLAQAGESGIELSMLQEGVWADGIYADGCLTR